MGPFVRGNALLITVVCHYRSVSLAIRPSAFLLQTHSEVYLEDGTLFGTLPLCTSWNTSLRARAAEKLGDDDLPANYDGARAVEWPFA